MKPFRLDSSRRLLCVSLKMYMGLERTRAWMQGVAALVDAQRPGEVEIAVLPAFLSIPAAQDLLKDTPVHVGAQNLFWEDAGAFTGEVSGAMLAEAGCTLVEVGHAERRRLFGETDAVVARKTAAAVRAGLVPLLCVGESVRSDPQAAIAACIEQLTAGTAMIACDAPLIVAWEPVWAIGQPSPAPSEYIVSVAAGLKAWTSARPRTRLIYGGSAGPGLLTQLGSAVDGLFLGRFAHDLSALGAILREASGSA